MIKTKGNEELKQKLIKLNSQTNYPSVTILFPVNQGEFGNGNSSQKLIKDLLREVNQKLSESSYRQEVEAVKQKLDTIADNIRFEADTKGVAVFISSDHYEIVPLPFTIESRALVGYGFHVRDLVFAMNSLEEYMVLHISEKRVLTLRGSGEQLSEIKIPDMPESIFEMGTYSDDVRYTDQHVSVSGNSNFVAQGEQDDTLSKLTNYINKIDNALAKYLGQENIRFVLLGVERNHGYFKKLSKNLDKQLTGIYGNYDHYSHRAIAELVWPEVHKKIAEEKEGYLRQLDEAVGRKQSISGISQAWQAAAEGRVKTLIVEKEYQCPAILSDDGFRIDLRVDGAEVTPDKLKEDAVDDLIELVLSKGGDIVFVENGKLETHQHLAAITRY
ncbi:MAG TPA: hypothetical protein VD908_08290 [Cytophagales bacterium]|nr:hypothetical protein [Cytophagales bacterium]